MTTENITNTVVDIRFDAITFNALSFSPIISDELRHVTDFVMRAVLGQILALFGMGSNMINILVFYRIGFKESINVGLFGLAVSDCMSCMTLAWFNLCFTPAFHKLDLPFRPLEIQYLTGGIPHVMFIKLTSCITAYIAFERCLCVIFPLKVKNMITPRGVAIFLMCTCVCILGLYSSVYYVCRLAWKFYPHLNKTLVGIIFTKDRKEVEQWVLPIRGIFLIWFLFTFTVICTVVLVVNLKKKTEWRLKAAAAASKSHSSQVSSRDTKAAHLVIFISVVFIVCYTPSSINSIVMSIEREISVGGRYQNLVAFLFSFSFMFESINASLNIFIYYYRSSKYRATFDMTLFKRPTKG